MAGAAYQESHKVTLLASREPFYEQGNYHSVETALVLLLSRLRLEFLASLHVVFKTGTRDHASHFRSRKLTSLLVC